MKKILAIENAITHLAGEEVVPIVRALSQKRTLSEQKLAQQVRQEVNQTRTMLYRLHQANLVTFIKKKDPKKGWFVYYWTLRKDRLKKLVMDAAAVPPALKEPRSAHQFRCNTGCTQVSLEDAMDLEFRCLECGELMGCDQDGRTVIELESTQVNARREIFRQH